jgi:hypothetical protein
MSKVVDPEGPGVDPRADAYDVLEDGDHPYKGDDAPTDDDLAGLPSVEELTTE